MIEKTLKKITQQLEFFSNNGVSLRRALDLLEASTQSLEEIVCLNTLRESLGEVSESKPSRASKRHPILTKKRASALVPFGIA